MASQPRTPETPSESRSRSEERKINRDHLKRVCRVGTELCCRYVSGGATGFECEKGTPLGAHLDRTVSRMRAKGDNCSGPPDFEERS